MYVSRAVRSLREDPIEGESVALALTTAEDAVGHRPTSSRIGTRFDDADPDAVAAAAEAAGATVERRLQFGDLAVTVPQTDIAAVCALDGLDAVETTDAIAITTAEATDEDVEFEG